MPNNDRLLVQILLLVLFGASFWVMAPFWSALFWGRSWLLPAGR